MSCGVWLKDLECVFPESNGEDIWPVRTSVLAFAPVNQ